MQSVCSPCISLTLMASAQSGWLQVDDAASGRWRTSTWGQSFGERILPRTGDNLSTRRSTSSHHCLEENVTVYYGWIIQQGPTFDLWTVYYTSISEHHLFIFSIDETSGGPGTVSARAYAESAHADERTGRML